MIFVSLSSVLLLTVAAAAALPPNIIWLQTDSMDGRLLDSTSPYYDKLKLTGIKKNLIGQGANFVRHYTASPQCVPSRTSMLTSRYVHEIDTTNNVQGIAASPKTGLLDSGCVAAWGRASCIASAATQKVNYTFLNLMESAGYDMQLFGRFDTGAGVLDDWPLHKPTGDGFHGGAPASLTIMARGANVPGTTKGDPLASTDTTDTNPYAGDVAVGGDVVNWLQKHNHATQTQPFFLWMGLIAPHPPYNTNATYMRHVNLTNVDVPPQNTLAETHPYDARMSLLKNCAHNYSDDDIKLMRGTYWGAVGEAMVIIEEIISAGLASGNLNNTWILYTSDHGEMSMEHRMDFKNNLREGSARVPLILAPYNVPGYENYIPITITDLTSHIDILPTLLDLAGASIPSDARGQSLVPLLLPPPSSSSTLSSRRTYITAEYHSNLGNTGAFMIRMNQWKLIEFGHTFPWFNATSYVPQLFDVDADPFELTNVASSNPTIVATLHAQMEEEWGGPGAIAAIDATQMARNFVRFKQVFGNLTPTALENDFLDVYQNISGDDIMIYVNDWIAASSTSTA